MKLRTLFTAEVISSPDMSGAVTIIYVVADDIDSALAAARALPEVWNVIGIKCGLPARKVYVV